MTTLGRMKWERVKDAEHNEHEVFYRGFHYRLYSDLDAVYFWIKNGQEIPTLLEAEDLESALEVSETEAYAWEKSKKKYEEENEG